jgi:hypothetical protein
MKTQLLCSIAICLLTLSCTKEKNINSENDQKYDVNFNLSTFSQEIVNLKSAKSLSDNIGYLYYFVYNNGGLLVSSKTQTSSDSTFGHISDKLLNGSYTILFVGGKNKCFIQNNDNLTNVYCSNNYVGFDSFYKLINITISNSNISQSVSLDRNVNYLEAIIIDTVPNNAAKISMYISDFGGGFRFIDGSTYVWNANIIDKLVGISDIGEPNFKIGTFMFPPYESFTVNLRCYDSSNTLLADKIINSVVCIKNKRTILTGKLFDGIGGGNASFTVTVNPTFDNDSIKVSF